MLDFRKQFQEIIEQSYIPFNIDKAATSDVWSNIYKLILPNIPEKLFHYAMQECFRISMIHIYI